MSWIYHDTRTFAQKFATKVLKHGEVPKHVAFILDGNRRWAKSRGLKVAEGHFEGLMKAFETIRWCIELGVEEITLYVFSLENFNREKQQVDELLDLFEFHCFSHLLEGSPGALREGWGIRVASNWDRVPRRLKPLFAKVMTATKGAEKKMLNFAFAYGSRWEMMNAFQTVEKGVNSNALLPTDLSVGLLDQVTRQNFTRPVDILIRTGGDTRLSDFMLWESTHAHIQFTDVAWPDYSFWNFFEACIKYGKMRESIPQRPSVIKDEEKERVDKFLNDVRKARWEIIEASLE